MIELRPAQLSDAQAITDIYNYYVLNSVVTFDIEPSSTSHWEEKITGLAKLDLPFLVATSDDEVIGFAFASRWREKKAYQRTVEDTLYLAQSAIRQGVGSALLAEIIERAQTAGITQILAVISAEGAEGSLALHESFGFRQVGRLERVGFKFDRWLDTVIMQKAL